MQTAMTSPLLNMPGPSGAQSSRSAQATASAQPGEIGERGERDSGGAFHAQLTQAKAGRTHHTDSNGSSRSGDSANLSGQTAPTTDVIQPDGATAQPVDETEDVAADALLLSLLLPADMTAGASMPIVLPGGVPGMVVDAASATAKGLPDIATAGAQDGSASLLDTLQQARSFAAAMPANPAAEPALSAALQQVPRGKTAPIPAPITDALMPASGEAALADALTLGMEPADTADAMATTAAQRGTSPTDTVSDVRTAITATANAGQASARQSGDRSLQQGSAQADLAVSPAVVAQQPDAASFRGEFLQRAGEVTATSVPATADPLAAASGVTAQPGTVQILDDATLPYQLQHHLRWMQTRGQGVAELQLNPAELGPVHVTLKMEERRVDASFLCAQPMTRDLLEAAMPRLREAMDASGMELTGSSVSTGDFGAADSGYADNGGGQTPRSAWQDLGVASAASTTQPVSQMRQSSHDGMVDTFA